MPSTKLCWNKNEYSPLVFGKRNSVQLFKLFVFPFDLSFKDTEKGIRFGNESKSYCVLSHLYESIFTNMYFNSFHCSIHIYTTSFGTQGLFSRRRGKWHKIFQSMWKYSFRFGWVHEVCTDAFLVATIATDFLRPYWNEGYFEFSPNLVLSQYCWSFFKFIPHFELNRFFFLPDRLFTQIRSKAVQIARFFKNYFFEVLCYAQQQTWMNE